MSQSIRVLIGDDSLELGISWHRFQRGRAVCDNQTEDGKGSC